MMAKMESRLPPTTLADIFPRISISTDLHSVEIVAVFDGIEKLHPLEQRDFLTHKAPLRRFTQ